MVLGLLRLVPLLIKFVVAGPHDHLCIIFAVIGINIKAKFRVPDRVKMVLVIINPSLITPYAVAQKPGDALSLPARGIKALVTINLNAHVLIIATRSVPLLVPAPMTIVHVNSVIIHVKTFVVPYRTDFST